MRLPKFRREYGTLVFLTGRTKYRFLWDWKYAVGNPEDTVKRPL